MKTAIIGTGAIGGYYGAMLARAGREVHFLLRSDFATVQRDGLRIQSPRGDFHLPEVNAWQDSRKMPPCDLILVALKTTALKQLQEILPPLLKPDSVVVFMQNGLQVEHHARGLLPPERILGALCFIYSERPAPGVIAHLANGALSLAPALENSPAALKVAEDVAAFLQESGLKVRAEKSLRTERWKKLMWNVPFNGLSVVMDAPTDKLLEHVPTRNLIHDMMEEVRGLAEACGHPVAAEITEAMLTATEKMPSYRPSMKQDADAGRPMETAEIYDQVLQAAADQGMTIPLIRSLTVQLDFIQQKLRRG